MGISDAWRADQILMQKPKPKLLISFDIIGYPIFISISGLMYLLKKEFIFLHRLIPEI
jgi:hypothetical protein